MRVAPVIYAQLVLHMLPGDMTAAELAEATGLHELTVRHYTRALHRAGAAHIAGWAPDRIGRMRVRLLKIGAGRDAPRPAPVHINERRRRLRATKRARRMIQLTAGATA